MVSLWRCWTSWHTATRCFASQQNSSRDGTSCLEYPSATGRPEKRPYTLSGAPAIKRELEALDFHDPPAIRTIEGILQRYGLTVPKQRDILQPFIREYPQPKRQQSNQLHELDLVGPRYFKGDSTKYYYSVLKDTFDQAVHVELMSSRRSSEILETVVHGWQRLGIPDQLQLDNSLEFRGSNRWPRSFSKIIRLCLLLGVEVIFIPAGMACRNGSVENFNGLLDRLFVNYQTFDRGICQSMHKRNYRS